MTRQPSVIGVAAAGEQVVSLILAWALFRLVLIVGFATGILVKLLVIEWSVMAPSAVLLVALGGVVGLILGSSGLTAHSTWPNVIDRAMTSLHRAASAPANFTGYIFARVPT